MTLDDAATCAWVRERVEDYVDAPDGGLSPLERAAIARHSAGCAACRAEVDTARALLQELRAMPEYAVPESVIATAQAALAEPRAVIRLLPVRTPSRAVRWAPAALAAAAVVLLVVTARWSGPVATEPSALADARVERATRETMLALSYVSHYTRMTGEIVAAEIMEKRVIGTVEKAIDRGVIDRALAPPLRRAMRNSDFVETNPARERS